MQESGISEDMGQKDEGYKTLLWWHILSVMSVFNIMMWISTALTADTKNDSKFEFARERLPSATIAIVFANDKIPGIISV